MELFNTIYKWRDLHASIIDESPSSMFTEIQLQSLITKPPTTVEEIATRTSVPRGSSRRLTVSESFETWGNVLLRFFTQGIRIYDDIMTIRCHNCRQSLGHAAWGCPQPWSMENTKLNLAEDPVAKNRQNHRRQVNKRRNKRGK